jgi:hypothetical protein
MTGQEPVAGKDSIQFELVDARVGIEALLQRRARLLAGDEFGYGFGNGLFMRHDRLPDVVPGCGWRTPDDRETTISQGQIAGIAPFII